jgi:hypothetical protein
MNVTGTKIVRLFFIRSKELMTGFYHTRLGSLQVEDLGLNFTCFR